MESFSRPPTDQLSEAGGRVIGIHGRSGVGKSGFAAAIVGNVPHLYVEAASVTDADQRRLVLDSIKLLGVAGEPTADASWEDILSTLVEHGVRAVVFDGLGALLAANRHFLGDLSATAQLLAADGPVPDLIFIDEDAAVLRTLEDAFGGNGRAARHGYEAPDFRTIRVDPDDFTSMARLCPSWSAEDVVAGYAIFGGVRRHLALIDPQERLATNVVRLVLAPDGALSSTPLETVRGRFQNPARYSSVIRSMANGATRWKELGAGMPELRGPGPLAPYLVRLEALDFVRARTSLDASSNSRRRRYELTDPFDQFWWSMVLPLRGALASGALSPEQAWKEHVEPGLTLHVGRIFPRVCRQFMARCGLGPAGTRGREIGALWGEGYDVPVAGTLVNGSIVYGDCHWHDRRPTEAWLDRLREQVQETRYGFGREARVRLLFTRAQPKERLRQALLRSEWTQRVGPTEMVTAARRLGD